MQTRQDIVQIVNRARKGDGASIKSLYDLYILEMLTTSKRITGSLQDAEDIIQESFVTAFNKLDKLKDAAQFRSWLKKIVINNSLQLTRSKVIWKEIADDQYHEEVDGIKWYEQVSLDEINRAIDLLPNGARQVFTLYLIEGYKHKEVAALLHIAVSTSKSQYRYALHQLKSELSKHISL